MSPNIFKSSLVTTLDTGYINIDKLQDAPTKGATLLNVNIRSLPAHFEEFLAFLNFFKPGCGRGARSPRFPVDVRRWDGRPAQPACPRPDNDCPRTGCRSAAGISRANASKKYMELHNREIPQA